MNTAISLGTLRLKNPVLVASGTFGYAEEFKNLIKVERLGALVTKTITLCPRQGNLPPRIAETPSGMLNSIGLENKGLDNFIKEKLPHLKKLDTPIVVSIAGESLNEYAELAKKLSLKGISALELNLSCPNIKAAKIKNQRGTLISQDASATYKVIKAVRRSTKKTIIAKLTPNVGDISLIARAAEDAGADSISLVNTFLAMSIDIKSKKPKLANITGGLSGPAIKPIALRMVWEVARAVKIPVVGCGGIMTASDAIEFIIAGARAVQIGTANFVNPKAATDIILGIKDYMRINKITNINKLIGSLKV
ncbi:MAG TPA: dihydroorotate dehydrogenase [Candidatus Omnitrophica bacterium]|nr:dihydroorotate dehydrogenase [Candidatus Omnitrophota bacterium]